MPPRMSLKSILVFDAGCAAFFTLLAFAFPSSSYNILSLTAFFVVLFFLHGLIVPIKGLSFILWDAPPDSAVKLYAFAAIFLAAFFGERVKIFIGAYLNLPING